MAEDRAKARTQLEPVDLRATRVSLADLAYDRLTRALIAQEIKPGERLYLDQLAESMGISRTPVKEALSRLMGEGLVRLTVGLGMSVAMPSADELTELFDARLMCEWYGVEKGLPDAASTAIERIAALVWRYERVVDSQEQDPWMVWQQINHDLHGAIVGLAGNRRILEWYNRLRVGTHSVRISFPQQAYRIQANVEEHEAILAALQARDVAAAKAAIRRHILGVRDHGLSLLSSYQLSAVGDQPSAVSSQASAMGTPGRLAES